MCHRVVGEIMTHKKNLALSPPEPSANLTVGSVMDADEQGWREWQMLTPGERLDACCAVWVSTYEVRKNARKNLALSIKNCFGAEPHEQRRQ